MPDHAALLFTSYLLYGVSTITLNVELFYYYISAVGSGSGSIYSVTTKRKSRVYFPLNDIGKRRPCGGMK